MDFELDETSQAVVQAAAAVLDSETPVDGPDAAQRVWKALAHSGLLTLSVPKLWRASAEAAPALEATIELVGQDRPGILRAVSGVFAAHAVNVEELSSERVSAPMGGGTLFRAKATVAVPSREVLAAVRLDLEKIAADLVIDLTIDPPRG